VTPKRGSSSKVNPGVGYAGRGAERLLRNAGNCQAMAERFAPLRTDKDTKELVPNPQHNEERYSYWLAMERTALTAGRAVLLQPLLASL
jgi:hypothetical protein